MTNGTEVRCLKCGRIWTTRAKKKAVCSDRKCKSQQVITVATGERYNRKSGFMKTIEQEQADQIIKEGADNLKRSMKIEVPEEPIAEKEVSGKTLLEALFQDDGKTPKTTAEMKAVFAGLPRPSPILVANIIQLSMLPARYLGTHWIISKEEAEQLASAFVAVMRDAGLKLVDIPPATLLALAFGIYAVPRSLPHIINWLFPNYEQKEPGLQDNIPVADSPVTDFSEEDLEEISEDEPVSKSRVAQRVDEQYDKFNRSYGGSLDEHGRDKYSSRRGIKKPKKKR